MNDEMRRGDEGNDEEHGMRIRREPAVLREWAALETRLMDMNLLAAREAKFLRERFDYDAWEYRWLGPQRPTGDARRSFIESLLCHAAICRRVGGVRRAMMRAGGQSAELAEIIRIGSVMLSSDRAGDQTSSG